MQANNRNGILSFIADCLDAFIFDPLTDANATPLELEEIKLHQSLVQFRTSADKSTLNLLSVMSTFSGATLLFEVLAHRHRDMTGLVLGGLSIFVAIDLITLGWNCSERRARLLCSRYARNLRVHATSIYRNVNGIFFKKDSVGDICHYIETTPWLHDTYFQAVAPCILGMFRRY